MTTTYDATDMTDVNKVRLLLNDVADPWVFQDEEIQAFLDLEAGSIKRAAAQAIDTNADNELLASKVITSQDVATAGDRVADALRKRAATLREQADADEGGGGYFDIVDTIPGCDYPELSGW